MLYIVFIYAQFRLEFLFCKACTSKILHSSDMFIDIICVFHGYQQNRVYFRILFLFTLQAFFIKYSPQTNISILKPTQSALPVWLF